MLKTPYKKAILEIYKKSLRQYYNGGSETFEDGIQYAIERIVDKITPEYNKYLEKEANKAFKKWGMK